MNKNKIIYWAATGVVGLSLLASGAFNLSKAQPILDSMNHLGFPEYFPTLLGTAKLLAAIAILYPRFPTLTEWAYAGVTFTMIGAFYAHLASGDTLAMSIPPIFILTLNLLSYSRQEAR